MLTSSEVNWVPAQVVKNCGATVFVPKDQLATAHLHELFVG
jgi:hypothetical protein